MFVTAKIEEKISDIPLPVQLNTNKFSYQLKFYMWMEIEIMRAFDWRVNLPTVAHF